MSARFPERGRPWEELSREMSDLKRDDLDWRGGRHAAFVWHADEAVEKVAREAYALFMTENGLGLRVFPSLRRTAKGASVILYRDTVHEACGRYEFSDWPTGLYAVPTFAGTRPGGAIAAAWAVMHYLGAEGYRRIAATVMQARERLVAGLARIEGLHVWGEPDLWAVAYGAEDCDILAVADAMSTRRWSVGRVRTPPGIHLMPTPVHAPIVDDYLADLAASLAAVRAGAGAPSRTPVVY